MNADVLFTITNATAAMSWLLLVLLPGRRWVTGIVTGRIVPMLLATAYAGIIAGRLGQAEGSFATLSGVALLFSDRWLLLAGWVHYLAFDLLIGTWEARDAVERGTPHVLLVPCLFLTFMLGPAGWLLYLSLRAMRARAAAGRSLASR